jgi:hypothetical protein
MPEFVTWDVCQIESTSTSQRATVTLTVFWSAILPPRPFDPNNSPISGATSPPLTKSMGVAFAHYVVFLIGVENAVLIAL